MIVLTPTTRDAIQEAGRQSYPDECCGLLLGRFVDGQRVALDAWPVANEWTTDIGLTDNESEHSLRDRFYIPPQAYLQAQRAAARQDMQIVGCYHSHPDDRAWPSERDRIGAAGVGGGPDFSFVIVSVHNGTPAELASALLSTDGQSWLPEDLSIEEI
jgi:proteasome lid subunit RPN8/RPN11